jgi:transcriptional regulator with XRE-family HTH domain
MTIGDRIRKRRRALGWSQQELARRLDMRRATIADLERGAQQETSTAVIRKLARALGVTADWLIGMYEDEEGEPAPAGMAVVGA